MEKVLQCDCGFEAHAEDEGELVAEVRRHAWEAHAMTLSHDEALLLAFRAELSQTSWTRRLASEVATDSSADGISDGKEEQ